MNVNWQTEEGSILDVEDYLKLKVRARGFGVTVKDYLESIGLVYVYRTGDHQELLCNSAEITAWCIRVDERLLFLTKWKYKKLSVELKGTGLAIGDYLRDCGYVMWKDLFDGVVTGWVDAVSGDPLYRVDYVKMSNHSGELCMNELLRSKGYVKLKEKKFNRIGSVVV